MKKQTCKLLSLLFTAHLFLACSEQSNKESAVDTRSVDIIKVSCEPTPQFTEDPLNYPVVGSPAKSAALKRINNYFTYSRCTGQFPKNSSFKPYFFSANDIGSNYQISDFNEGFNKQPASLLIKTNTNLSLLFCFNQMVINCNETTKCECPYDFNFEPKSK